MIFSDPRVPVKLIVGAAALEAGPAVHTDDVHPGVAH